MQKIVIGPSLCKTNQKKKIEKSNSIISDSIQAVMGKRRNHLLSQKVACGDEIFFVSLIALFSIKINESKPKVQNNWLAQSPTENLIQEIKSGVSFGPCY